MPGMFGGFPRTFWVLFTGTLVNRIGTFVTPFLALYLTEARGLSVRSAGLVMGIYGVGAIASQMIGGGLTDRIGRRATIVSGMTASAVALAALGFARPVWQIAAAAFATGLVGDIYRPAVGAMIADVVAPADRDRAYALNFWAINIGFAIAAFSAGAIARHGYGILFVVDAATMLVFAALVLRLTCDTRPTQDGRPERTAWSTVLSDRLLLAVCGLSLLDAVAYFQAFTTLPLAMARHHLDSASYGLVISLNGILIAIGQPIATPHLVRFRRVSVLVVSSLVLGVGFAATALATTTPGYAAAAAAWTVGEVIAAGALAAVVAAIAPAAARGRYMGAFGTSFGVAIAIAPVIGTTVLAGSGATTLWLGCGVAFVLGAAGWAALGPALRRRAPADRN